MPWSHVGEAHHPGDPDPDNHHQVSETITRLHELYDSGLPLFTKGALQRICEQLDDPDRGDGPIFIEALDGTSVSYEVETGRVIPVGKQDEEFIIGAPYVLYRAFQHLTSRKIDCYNDVTYCNLAIQHHMYRRKKSTKKLMDKARCTSFQEIDDFFQSSRDLWEASDACEELKSSIASLFIQHPIRKIIAFACGSMTYLKPRDKRQSRRSTFQHALILTLKDILDERRKTETNDGFVKEGNDNEAGNIKCFAQDPDYSDIDRAVLEEHGITVLDDPRAFIEVDDSSVVFSCAADAPVKEIVSEIARPAIMIWDRVVESDVHSKVLLSDPVFPRVLEMTRSSYDEVEFPEDGERFSAVAIYVKKKNNGKE